MNIEYVGQQNIFLNGEPSKSFFKSGYKTYTNFGMQKFRIDYNIDKQIYDDFVKACSRKGYAPNVIVERLMKKFIETGQM